MKLNNRFYFLLLGSVAFFFLAFGLEKYCNTDRLLKQYLSRIEANLRNHEREIDRQLADESFIKNCFRGVELDINKVETLAKNHFNISLYESDSLLFWSNAIAFPDKSLLKELKSTKETLFRKLSNGYFAIQKKELPYMTGNSKYAVTLIPVKWAYIENLPHLVSHFEAGSPKSIPPEIEVSLQPTDYPVYSLDNSILFYLKNTKAFKDDRAQKWILISYLLGFICLSIFINSLARKLIIKNKPWVGPAFLIITVFGLRFLSLNWSAKFQDFEVFARTFDNPHVSVGDLLINIILLLWVVIFIHRESKNKDFKVKFPKNTRLFLTSMNYLSVVLALLLLISVLKSLVLNSGIDFDFKNVFSLDQYSVFAVLGIILLLFTQFVFSHRMMITIHKLNLSREKRLLALGIAIFLALPIIHFIDLQIPLLYAALLSFIFVTAYDLFIDIPNPGLVWLVGWVILFAGFSSTLLYKYNMDKEAANEIFMAKALAEERDTLAEKAIINLKAELALAEAAKISTEHSNLFSQKTNEFLATINFNQNYLYTNYEYEVYAYDEYGKQISSNNTAFNLDEWQSILTKSSTINNHANIFLNIDDKENYTYFLLKKLPNIASGSSVPQLIFSFKKAPRKRAKVYTNLLARQEFKGLTDLVKYDYAIIKNGSPIIEEGITDPVFREEPAIGDYVKNSHKDLVYFMYRSGLKDYIILSKPKNNLFHPISLFSFIFGFLVLMILLFALLNSKLNILPDNFNFHFWNKPSLKNRIQFSTILLTLNSFFIIGVVSVYFLTESYISYDKSRLERKVSGVQTSAEQYLKLEKDSLDLFKKHIHELAKAQRIDVNLFDLNGELIQSSEMDIFKRGILPTKMNAFAFKLLQHKDKSDLVKIEESISNQHFISAFTPILNSKGDKAAYLGVPYANQQRNLRDDVLSFLGNLLNVYVFLLIIAGGISVYVANTITRPISTIGENLKEIKLGKPNEPLEWRTNDEIGALIAEYNRMILKLEHSAKLLARSEREGAWREMAKQVAHEIKNPLTPMKLSIQYLQHAFRSNPDNIEPLLKRVSVTLIEQIDSLAQIADEFSNFAKMPRANNQQIKLNDLVESVHDLFKESQNTDVLLSLPNNDFYVFADKNHLMRVLNNMIKNAVEAIPDSRQGKIDVSLYKLGDMAVIKVEDNGVGIPEDMQNKVFVPNFTTKNSGTGLGLAISKNIIESVSGKIYFETEKDVGTRFFVELPLEDMVLAN